MKRASIIDSLTMVSLGMAIALFVFSSKIMKAYKADTIIASREATIDSLHQLVANLLMIAPDSVITVPPGKWERAFPNNTTTTVANYPNYKSRHYQGYAVMDTACTVNMWMKIEFLEARIRKLEGK